MGIRVNIFYPKVQQYTNNQDVVEVDGKTVGECLNDLVKQFPSIEKWIFSKRGQLLEHVFVYVNAESTTKANLSDPVKESDTLIIAVLVTGG